MSGDERADVLAGEATKESTLTLDPPTVLALLQEHIQTTRVTPAPPRYA